MNYKTYYILIASFLAVTSLHAQDILWEHSYGGKHAEFLYDAQSTADYGFILAGSSISSKNGNKTESNKGDLDYWIWKMDEKGTPEWQKSFGGNGVDLLQSIRITNDGGFILAGTSTSSISGDKKDESKGLEDFWIIKLDARGQELWQRTIGGSGQDILLSIAQTKDGGYILGGSSSSNKSEPTDKGIVDKYGKQEDSRGGIDYWVVKLDSNGEIEWDKTIGGKYKDELKSIEQTKDDGFIIGGYSNSPESGEKSQKSFGFGDYWVLKLDKEGNIQWQETIGGDKDDNLFALTQTNDGGYIIGGNSNSGATHSKTKSNKNGTDFWVVKINEVGSIEWQRTYNFGKYDVLTSIVENRDGTFLIGGYAQSETKSKIGKSDKEGINDYIALKLKVDGDIIWKQTFGSKGDEVLKKLFETRDGGYILAGTSKGEVSRDKNSNIGGSDFWVIKLGDKDKKKKGKEILEAIPNPVESFTNAIVGYDYKKGTATLYDLSGRRIQSVKIFGERTIPFNLSGLPQGIYVIEVKTDTSTDGVKVIKN